MPKSATKVRIKKNLIPIPENLAGAEFQIGKIGRCQREIDRITLGLNERVARLKEEAAREMESYKVERRELLDGLYAFAAPRKRKLLADAGKKTIELLTGKFLWRRTPPSVSVDDDAAAIETLKDLGLTEFIRTKEELDREALLKARNDLDPIEGIGFVQTEEFVVVPKDQESEVKKTRTVHLDREDEE